MEHSWNHKTFQSTKYFEAVCMFPRCSHSTFTSGQPIVIKSTANFYLKAVQLCKCKWILFTVKLKPGSVKSMLSSPEAIKCDQLIPRASTCVQFLGRKYKSSTAICVIRLKDFWVLKPTKLLQHKFREYEIIEAITFF